MTPAEALVLLGVVKRIYPMQEISLPIAETWAAVLHDVSAEEMTQAVYAYMRTGGEFPPKPAQLLSILSRERIGSSLIPEEAWSEVMSEVRRIGMGYHRPGLSRSFSSPLIERAVRAIGWEAICMSDLDNIPTIRAQFIKVLAAQLDHHRRADQLGAGREPALPAERAAVLPEGVA